MAQSKANCKFCSRTDNSIQVICETRCLICSRCQLMPGIRKLLIDHSNTNGTLAAKSGRCPICESPISLSMMSLIATFKESFRKIQTDEIGGKLGSEIELEENSAIITNFLKRFRITYSDEKTTKAESGNEFVGGVNDSKHHNPSATDTHDNVTPSTQQSIIEITNECYLAQWQCVLRNSNESMSSILMRLTNRKKFSQKTIDTKTKSIINFLMSPTGAETPDLLLFGKLIGVQPKLTNNISTAWAHISISVIVAAHMDRCLKFGQLNDVAGNPTVSELRQKLMKIGGVAGGGPKTITLKKAIKIVSLLSQVQHPYWTMSPLAAACIEYNCKLPWRDDSISKLLTVLFHVVLYEPSLSAPPSAPTTAGSTTRRGSTMGSSMAGGSLPMLSPAHTNFNTPQTGRSHAGFSTPATPLPDVQAVERTVSSRSMAKPGNMNELSTVAPVEQSAKATQHSAKIQALKDISTVAKRVWAGQMQSRISQSADKNVLFEYFKHLDQGKSAPGFVRLTYEKAISLSENQNILVSELALALIECWEVEYAEIKVAMARGKLTSKRRMGISGNYDTTQAKLTAVERLAMTRLLHWYSVEGESRGVDWEDVDNKFQDRLFPFTIPSSLMAKSRNELDYLAGVVWGEMKQQQSIDQLAESASEDGPYSTHNRGVRNAGTSSLIYSDEDNRTDDDYVTMEEIERYNREQYLASQSVGYVGEEFSGYCDLQERDLVEDEAHKHKHRSNSAYGTHFAAKKVLKRNNTSAGSLHAVRRDTDDIMHRTASLSTLGGRPLSPGGLNRDTMSPEMFSQGMEPLGYSKPTSASSSSRPKTPLSRLSYESPAPGPHNVNMVDVLGVGGGVLTNARLLPNNSIAGKNKLPIVEVASHPSGVPTTLLEHEVNNMRIVEARAPKSRSHIMLHSDSNSQIPPHESPEVNADCARVRESYHKSRVMAARSRIKTRIDASSKTSSTTQVNESDAVDITAVPSYLSDNCRVTQVLNLNEYVNKFGAVTVDLTTNLTAESIVKCFTLRNTCITPKSFQYVVDNYLKPWQLDSMVRIDVDGNKGLGIAGAKVLAGKLSVCCRLVHLNMSGVLMGDTGLRHILNAIVKGGGQSHLLRLDVSLNNITMVSLDSIDLLGQLHNLRALDVSKNCFTLDTKIQRSFFATALTPLSNLQSLSVAYNKIQHDGFQLIASLVADHLHSLRQLDLAGCFISSKSYTTLTTLLDLTREVSTGINTKVAKLEEVMFQDNLFSYAHTQDLHSLYDGRGDVKLVLTQPHLGISYPLRYDPKDYGIDSYQT